MTNFSVKGSRALGILLCATLLFVGVVSYAYYFGPSYQRDTKEYVVVSPGEPLYLLAQRLEEKGIVVSAFAFQTAYRLVHGDSDVTAGAYELTAKKDVWSNVDALTKRPAFAFITIPVGVRKEQVFTLLEQKLSWDQEDEAVLQEILSASTSGYIDGLMLPGTYFIDASASPDAIVALFYTRFMATYEELRKSATKEVSPEEAIVIASMIQREAAGKGDAGLVSGVIWNRLAVGMPLMMDATLQYAKGTPGKWWPVPLSEDKYIESPYNTYQHEGLPPGAISNASLTMLRAAMNPEETSCLFYIHDASRRIHCADTYTKHVANIEAYLR